MRDFLKILKSTKFVAIIVVMALVSGCEATFEDNSTQQEDIISFLTTDHSPQLIALADVNSSLISDPPFYTSFGDTSYRYIEDYYNTERDSKTEIKKGSSVTLLFYLYPFEYEEIDEDELPTYTNDVLFQELYEEAGLNTTYWSFEPLVVTIGSSDLIDGIDTALVGCREGDVVEIYMTRNMGYGSNVIGTIPQDSPLAFFATIVMVE